MILKIWPMSLIRVSSESSMARNLKIWSLRVSHRTLYSYPVMVFPPFPNSFILSLDFYALFSPP